MTHSATLPDITCETPGRPYVPSAIKSACAADAVRGPPRALMAPCDAPADPQARNSYAVGETEHLAVRPDGSHSVNARRAQVAKIDSRRPAVASRPAKLAALQGVLRDGALRDLGAAGEADFLEALCVARTAAAPAPDESGPWAPEACNDSSGFRECAALRRQDSGREDIVAGSRGAALAAVWTRGPSGPNRADAPPRSVPSARPNGVALPDSNGESMPADCGSRGWGCAI
jgi:hypothetical protein